MSRRVLALKLEEDLRSLLPTHEDEAVDWSRGDDLERYTVELTSASRKSSRVWYRFSASSS